MTNSRLLAMAGFIATAVAFGPARIGYGLFLPAFRDEFALSTEMAGSIASAAFLAFLASLLIAGSLLSRIGPATPIMVGGVCSLMGMGLVCLASNSLSLASGVILAAASAGFAWTPYNFAVENAVPANKTGRVLSTVTTGTTVGVALAGLLALTVALYDFPWRVAWFLFALSGGVMLLVNGYALFRTPTIAGHSVSAPHRDGSSVTVLFSRTSVPLVLAALSFGITGAVYLSFAFDTVKAVGDLEGLPDLAIGPLMYAAFGVAGISGLAAADIAAKIGVTRLLTIVFLCSSVSMILVGVAPGAMSAAILSAALQGVCVMTFSATLSFWSMSLFPSLPSLSLTAALVAMALGNAVSPVAAGFMAGAIGQEAVFLFGGAISLGTAIVLPAVINRELVQSSSL
jgi:predicted MFS family arabinose efflux permease